MLDLGPRKTAVYKFMKGLKRRPSGFNLIRFPNLAHTNSVMWPP